MNPKQSVLFLCTGNSCRSQMAEGFMRHLHSDTYTAYSAGIETHGVNPRAVRVMREIGIDISDHSSKNVSEFSDSTFDYVVTVCDNARENCPYFPAQVKIIHHSFDDPPALAKNMIQEHEILACYRRVREQIHQFIKNFASYIE